MKNFNALLVNLVSNPNYFINNYSASSCVNPNNDGEEGFKILTILESKSWIHVPGTSKEYYPVNIILAIFSLYNHPFGNNYSYNSYASFTKLL